MIGTTRFAALKPVALAVLLIGGITVPGALRAQTATPDATAQPPATAQPTTPVPSPAPAAPAGATTPTPTTPPAADSTPTAPPDSKAGASPGDSSISQMLDVKPRPAAVLSGSATWDDGFKTLTEAFTKLTDALAKNGLAPAGRPLAVFTATDDAGFKYSAMIPLAQAPEGKTELSPDIKISETPSGKAIRFQHRAGYDDIDSTYEAITAYLDEKGLESRNLFAEEYLKMTKTSDDPTLEVDIYVFLK